jgi:F-type H+-transporting ATPase subunit b
MEHAVAHASIADLLWPAINFVLFVGLLVRFLGGPVREYFHERAERLRDALAAGVRARQEAEKLRAEIARDVADMPAVREQLRAELRTTGERGREQLLATGRAAAERIRTEAGLTGEQELAGARQALRGQFVDDAVREATALVRAALRPEDQQQFIREFVERAGVTK